MMKNLCKFLKRFSAVKFLYNLMTGILLIFLFSFKKCRIVILTDCGPLIPLLVDLPISSDVKAHSCLIFLKCDFLQMEVLGNSLSQSLSV